MNEKLAVIIEKSVNYYDNHIDVALKEIEMKMTSVANEGDTRLYLTYLNKSIITKLMAIDIDRLIDDIQTHFNEYRDDFVYKDTSGRSIIIDWSGLND